jgi:PAS domain S-box-containing protein
VNLFLREPLAALHEQFVVDFERIKGRLKTREDFPMTKKPAREELEKKISSLQRKIAGHQKRASALEQNQERLSRIIDSIPIPTFVIDHNHRVIHYNRAMENLTGIPAEKIVGTRDQWRAFYAAERPCLADFILNKASEKQIERYYRGKYHQSPVKEGAYEAEDFFADIGADGKWLFFTAAPLTDSKGTVFGSVETLQDTTERKRAEGALIKSERRFRTLLDVAPYAIVVFSMDGLVTYLNPAFTEIFGWSFEELKGKKIPYVPRELKQETSENISKLFQDKLILRHETKRLTKSGRMLDVVIRASVISEAEGEPAGELVILRDITLVKRITRNNEAMLRISMALPEYPELDELLDYVSGVIKELIGTEGGVVILLDAQRQELFMRGAAYDDSATQQRVKESRFSMDELVSGKVIKSGKPMIINDTSKDAHIHIERDKRLGYQTRNLLLVPVRSQDRSIGVLCAINKKEGNFDQSDADLLSMLAGTVALSIENARFSEELKKAYMEVSSLNRAKYKVINLLSHELRTPIAVLHSCLVSMEKKMSDLPEDTWKPTLERARRNLDRLLEMQYQLDDIMQDKTFQTQEILSEMVEQCADELEALVAEEIGEESVIARIRKRIEQIFGPKEQVPEKIQLDTFVGARLERLAPSFAHRQVVVDARLDHTPLIFMPTDPLQKVVDGLVKNAVENTPDEGKIEVIVQRKGEGAALVVRDFGVGITEENQKRIFEGFFTTRETMNYSSKRPFDFNAGGKGADLFRMKIFSERHNFKIEMKSKRCRFIPRDSDACPGRISVCPVCKTGEGCHQSPATTFTLYFPPAP